MACLFPTWKVERFLMSMMPTSPNFNVFRLPG